LSIPRLDFNITDETDNDSWPKKHDGQQTKPSPPGLGSDICPMLRGTAEKGSLEASVNPELNHQVAYSYCRAQSEKSGPHAGHAAVLHMEHRKRQRMPEQ
jgi:hypothetical protein